MSFLNLVVQLQELSVVQFKIESTFLTFLFNVFKLLSQAFRLGFGRVKRLKRVNLLSLESP